MALSIEELQVEVGRIRESSEELASFVSASGARLERRQHVLAGLSQGSQSGQEAVMAIASSVKMLQDATLSLKDLCSACDGCIAHLKG